MDNLNPESNSNRDNLSTLRNAVHDYINNPENPPFSLDNLVEIFAWEYVFNTDFKGYAESDTNAYSLPKGHIINDIHTLSKSSKYNNLLLLFEYYALKSNQNLLMFSNSYVEKSVYSKFEQLLIHKCLSNVSQSTMDGQDLGVVVKWLKKVVNFLVINNPGNNFQLNFQDQVLNLEEIEPLINQKHLQLSEKIEIILDYIRSYFPNFKVKDSLEIKVSEIKSNTKLDLPNFNRIGLREHFLSDSLIDSLQLEGELDSELNDRHAVSAHIMFQIESENPHFMKIYNQIYRKASFEDHSFNIPTIFAIQSFALSIFYADIVHRLDLAEYVIERVLKPGRLYMQFKVDVDHFVENLQYVEQMQGRVRLDKFTELYKLISTKRSFKKMQPGDRFFQWVYQQRFMTEK